MKRLAGMRLHLGFLVLSACIAMGACHSYHIEATVKNDTGGSISLLEVDYPSASFGADTVTAGDTFHHRIQTRGNGALKVQYTDAAGKQVQITGPTLYEGQEGSLEIDLLANGKAEFHPALNPAH